MTPLESMRLTAEDPATARRAATEIITASIGTAVATRDELAIITVALEAVVANMRSRIAAWDAHAAREAEAGRRLLDALAQEPRP